MAVHALTEAGFRGEPSPISYGEIQMRHPSFPMPLDLHHTLFHHTRFRLPARHVIARSRPLGGKFGPRARVTAPLDLAAHMVGHWVLHVDLTRGAVTERAQFDLIVE